MRPKPQLAGAPEAPFARQDLVQPRPRRRDRLRPEPEHPRPCVRFEALVLDHEGLEENAQVPADSRGRHADLRRYLARPARPAAEQRHHLPPDGVAERLDNRPGPPLSSVTT